MKTVNLSKGSKKITFDREASCEKEKVEIFEEMLRFIFPHWTEAANAIVARMMCNPEKADLHSGTMAPKNFRQKLFPQYISYAKKFLVENGYIVPVKGPRSECFLSPKLKEFAMQFDKEDEIEIVFRYKASKY